MASRQGSHPAVEQLDDYLLGRLTGDESQFVGEHLDDCADCCRRIESLATSHAAHGEFQFPEDGLSASRTAVMLLDRCDESPRVHELAVQVDPEARYELFEQIAEGGMAVVYRARDRHLERDVAVKVLSAGGRNPKTRSRRFQHEAHVLGMLQHPGIPPVFDRGVLPDGRPFIAMKLISGSTLADLLDQRTSPQSELMHFLGVFKQICETVAFAHAQAIVHRDLKPENIMVGAFGEVQVMDWGLAKRLAFEADADNSRASTPDLAASSGSGNHAQTMDGAIIGTPAYMPPEQSGVSSYPIDERADVFSLGAILCEILTGQPPYTGEKVSEMLEQARSANLEHAEQRLLHCSADTRLVRLTLNCLQSDPNRRIQSAREIADTLENEFESIQSRLRNAELKQARDEQIRQRRRLRVSIVVSGLLLVTVLTGGWAIELRHHNRLQAESAAALHEVSVALGEASKSAEHATQQPMQSDTLWLSAKEAVRRAELMLTNVPGVADADLERQLHVLSERIHREASLAAQDREFLAELDDAGTAVAVPRLPRAGSADSLDDVPPGAGRPSRGPQRRPVGPGFGPGPEGPGPREPGMRGPGPGRGGPGRGSLDESPHGPRPRHGDANSPFKGLNDLAREARAQTLTARYVAALTTYGLDPHLVSADDAAQRIKTRHLDVQREIIAALHTWLAELCHPSHGPSAYRGWVLKIVNEIDPDAERTEIRILVERGDRDAIESIAADDAILNQKPAFIWLVACQLESAGDMLRLLREARARYPNSLLLNQSLGEQLMHYGRGREAIDAYMAALAIRPNAILSVNAGFLLTDHERHEEATALLRNATHDYPSCLAAWSRLAQALTRADRPDEAVTVVDEALTLFSSDDVGAWELYLARGEASHELGDTAAARQDYEQALQCPGVPEPEVGYLRQCIDELTDDVESPLP